MFDQYSRNQFGGTKDSSWSSLALGLRISLIALECRQTFQSSVLMSERSSGAAMSSRRMSTAFFRINELLLESFCKKLLLKKGKTDEISSINVWKVYPSILVRWRWVRIIDVTASFASRYFDVRAVPFVQHETWVRFGFQKLWRLEGNQLRVDSNENYGNFLHIHDFCFFFFALNKKKIFTFFLTITATQIIQQLYQIFAIFRFGTKLRVR